MLQDGALRREAYKDGVGATSKNPAKVSRLDSPIGPLIDTSPPPSHHISHVRHRPLHSGSRCRLHLALPNSRERLDHRVAKHEGGVHQSLPRQTNASHVEYSSNCHLQLGQGKQFRSLTV